MKRRNTAIIKLTNLALLLALTVILGRIPGLSWYLVVGGVQLVKLGFSSLPLMVCSFILGPIYGLVCGLVSDLIGAILFPSGAFFFGYTLDAALLGFLPGLVIYIVRDNRVKALIAGIIIDLIMAICLFITLPYVETMKLGDIKIELNTTLKIFIPLILFAYFLIWMLIFFFLEKLKKKTTFSLLEVYVAYLSRDFLVTTLLAPLWSLIAYNVAYPIGVATQITTKIINIPIFTFVCFLILIPISIFEKNIIEDTYKPLRILSKAE